MPALEGGWTAGFELPSREEMRDTVHVLAQARAGEERAFASLWRRFAPALEAVLGGQLGGRDATPLQARLRSETADLVQETMIRASQKLHEFEYRGNGSLFFWLRRIALNQLRNRIEFWQAGCRDVEREQSLAGWAETGGMRLEPEDRAPGPVTCAEHRERLHRVGLALESLEPLHRDLLYLYHFTRSTWPQIGQELGLDPEVARKTHGPKALQAFARAMATSPSAQADS